MAVRDWVTWYGAYVNVCPAMGLFRLVRSDPADGAAMGCLVAERQGSVRMATRPRRADSPAFRGLRLRPLSPVYGPSVAGPRRRGGTGLASGTQRTGLASGTQRTGLASGTRRTSDLTAMPERRSQARSVAVLPRWLKRNVPKGNANHFTARLIEELRLQTVCDHAHCPNRMECYAAKTATVMILGDVCTRACRFCSVRKGQPRPVDADEPRRVAAAAARLGLAHVVVTCVTRDDLPDGGAEHFVRDHRGDPPGEPAPRSRCSPRTSPATLAAVDRLLAAGPEVYNHNSETVPRLYGSVRGAPGRLPLDAGHVPPHRPAGAGHPTQDRPDARTGRDDRGASGDAGRVCARPAAGC